MPTPARSATAEIGASAPWAAKTSRAASSTARSLRRASACRPRPDRGYRDRNAISKNSTFFGANYSDNLSGPPARGLARRPEGDSVVRAVMIREFGPLSVLEPAEAVEVSTGPDDVIIDVEFANITFVETQIRAG